MANQTQNSDEPSLCANNCGFYGSPAANNLCSKCHKEYLMKQAKEVGKKICDDNKVLVEKEILGDKVDFEQGKTGFFEGLGSGSSSSNNAGNRPANRCSWCKKRVGLTGFRCRCGQTFCSMHRYSDKHECVFDYKGEGQDAIARANPMVKGDKIDKI